MFTPLKTAKIPFPPNTPHQAVRYTPSNLHMTVLPKWTLLASQNIQNRSGHYPMNTKQGKNHILNLPRKRAVKQVIHRFPIRLTQTTPTNQYNVPIPQVISCEYFPQGSYPHKKRNREGTFSFQMFFQGKEVSSRLERTL